MAPRNPTPIFLAMLTASHPLTCYPSPLPPRLHPLSHTWEELLLQYPPPQTLSTTAGGLLLPGLQAPSPQHPPPPFLHLLVEDLTMNPPSPSMEGASGVVTTAIAGSSAPRPRPPATTMTP